MRVLAIGAAGFIGPHVVGDLIGRGHEVAVLHRGSSKTRLPDGARRILGDRDSLASVRLELERFAPDVVVDIILYTEKQALDLVRTLRGVAGRVVAISSADVYRNYDGLRGKGSAPPDPVPLSEQAPLRQTLYPYRGSDIEFAHREDYEKILVERAVMNAPDIAGTVLRLPAVYGPGDKQHRLRPYLQQMAEGRAEILLGENQARWRFTRGYVGNVAAAIAVAVGDPRAAGRIYNVGDDAAYSEAEWVERIGAVAGWRGAVRTAPDDQLPQESRQPYDWRHHLATDTTRIREELGFREPVSRDDALQATVKWERSS